mgnify:CR=1 FL=1
MPDPYITQQEPTKVAVIHPVLPPGRTQQDVLHRDAKKALEEAVNLCHALPLEVCFSDAVNVRDVSPHTLLGKGKVAELRDVFAELGAQLVVVNTRLQPSQQRNLELGLQTKVIDRTGLILEIFGERAQTHAGRLQVQLAQLQYQASRLVRSWTHLERQRGGLGKTGGPGERQIELDKRMIQEQIDKIKKELAEVEKTRALHRKGRAQSNLPVVALVGYTNAGKSTLFNALAEGEAFVKNMLFATLDPLMRKVRLKSGREIILSDTVGFVSYLPHELVKAFHATLEEVLMADLLVHVQDAANPDRAAQEKDVADVLKSIGAENLPVLDVYNKQDLPSAETPEKGAIGVSAQAGKGLESLEAAVEEFFAGKEEIHHFEVPATDGRTLAWLHAHGDVKQMTLDDNEIYQVEVLLSPENASLFNTI